MGIKKLGRLEKGALADIVLLDMSGAEWCPKFDLVSLLAYSASVRSVDTVMVNGKVLMEKGEMMSLDEERICYEANRCAMRISH